MEVAALHAQHFFTSHQRYCLRISPFSLPSLLTLKNPNFRPKSKLGFIKGFSFRCRTMAYSTIPAVQVKEKIDVNEKEEQIFEQLLQVVHHFKLKTQLRVAGGWVRDKLLGKECHDIDIALDDMLGKEFCEKVNDYFSHTGEANKSVHVIQSNPNQSKHLETANMRLLDVPIDFVNLRSETYSENSRIPTMEFGTAEQDAYRRDLTINSLFYNINTKSVEDFTRRGISDLKSGKIVTPLPPKETFLDDPLRVLRAIRFGARFGFVLDEELKEAAASEEVKAAIADKISRERIGHEIDLMVSGNQPVQAMTYICDLQLFWVVFSLLPETELSLSEGCDRLCISYMEAAWDLLQLIGCEVFDDKQKRLYLYGALFLPLRQSVYKGNKGKKTPLVNHIFGKSLKLKANDAEMVISLHSAIEGSEESKGFMSLIPVIASNVDADSGRGSLQIPVSSKQRVLAGLLLKDIKGLWRVSLLLCTLVYPVSFDHSVALLDRRIALEKCRDLFMKVESIIIEFGLDKVWEMKPLVSGKELMSILQLKTGGPQVKEWQDELTKWQLEYPSGTAEEFFDWMRETLLKREKEWQGELTKWQLAHPSGTVKELLDWVRETHSKRVKEWQGELTKWQLAYPSGTAEEFLNWIRETHSKRAKLE